MVERQRGRDVAPDARPKHAILSVPQTFGYAIVALLLAAVLHAASGWSVYVLPVAFAVGAAIGLVCLALLGPRLVALFVVWAAIGLAEVVVLVVVPLIVLIENRTRLATHGVTAGQ